MPRALLNFVNYGDQWSVHFLQEDCRTSLGTSAQWMIHFNTEENFLAFVVRCNPEPPSENEEEYEQSFEEQYEMRGQGSVFVQLTDEQYARLAK